MIDWERPKFFQHNFIQKDLQQSETESKRSKFDVNAWRHMFLINEFCELQTFRMINCEIILISYAVIMEGIGLTNWVNYNPNLSIYKDSSPRNFALMFFVTTCIIYAVGIT